VTFEIGNQCLGRNYQQKDIIIMWLSSITVKRNRGANVIRNLIQEAPLSQREAARCFVSVSSFIQHVHRNLLLLVTSASDLPLRTIKFCSVLFSSAYSLMRAWRVGLCHKQTCAGTVIYYCTDDRQLLIEQSSIR